LDDLIFLSAALTRLVIDPYREACSTRTRLSRTEGIGRLPDGAASVDLEQPFLFTGFDESPEPVRKAAAMALAATGCGYVGRRALPKAENEPKSEENPRRLRWFQLVLPGEDPSPEADGLLHPFPGIGGASKFERLRSDQLLGVIVHAGSLSAAVPHALGEKLDVILLDGAGGIQRPWVELDAPPDWTLIRDALRLLRELGREEEIALVHFGGMRSGTDVAKILALNGQACVFGVAAGLALGGAMEEDGLRFDPSASPEEMSGALVNWIQSTSQEAAIIARCAGKTRVHNLEPEDMRTISIAASRAFDIPLASGQNRREAF
jgi:hypothetical protein